MEGGGEMSSADRNVDRDIARRFSVSGIDAKGAHMKRVSGVCLVCLALAGLGITAETEVPQRSAEFFPLGVYWPGEYVFRAADKQFDWPRNEAILDSLAKHGCNAIWLTHTSAGDAAEFARRAAKRGIYLVAALGELDGSAEGARKADHAARIANVLKAWDGAPPPIAWGLGDEPRTGSMPQMKAYAEAWSKAGQPVTCVVMAGDMPSAATLLDQKFLCTDIYPYFSTGNPNGPDNWSASTTYYLDAGRKAWKRARARNIEWWMMGAIFQEPWGPRDLDEKGNLVYLPGGNAHFRMPTSAEVRWENWAALAAGARGVIHFSLFFKQGAYPNEKPLGPDLPFAVKEKTNSNAPGGILYDDGRLTPQYEAMGESFVKIARLADVLKRIEPTDDLVAFHARGWVPPGDVVQPFRPVDQGGEAANVFYAVVVNGNIGKAIEVPVNLRGDVVTVTDLCTGQDLEIVHQSKFEWEPIGAPFGQVRVNLAPGDGTLLRLRLKD
jgi:hypothetical protein